MGSKTVFILGAGASKPYGFPTGIELRDEICNKFYMELKQFISSQRKLHGEDTTLNSLATDPFLIKAQQFIEVFNRSDTLSIDLFLSRNPSFQDIGKMAIVQRILGAESRSKFHNEYKYSDSISGPSSSQDWYSLLFHEMTKNLLSGDDFDKLPIQDYSFITFNYDRSFEYFFWDSFIHSFFEIEESKKKEEVLSYLKIYHVYGSVDYLPWENKVRDDEVTMHDYGNTNYDLETLKRLASNIKVIHDDNRKSHEQISLMKYDILHADKLVFLGFAFAKENLDILGIPNDLLEKKRIRKIYFTNFKEPERKSKELFDFFQGTYSNSMTGPSPIYIGKTEWDCQRLLKEYDVF